MSVTLVTEKVSKSLGIDERLNSTYTRDFFVHTDELATEHEIALADDGTTAIPDMYSRHPVNTNALLVDKRCSQNKDQPLLWEVSCKYSTKTVDPSQQSQDKEDILNETPTINGVTERVQIVVDKDKDGDDILNSAGDKFFDPAPTKDEILRVYSISFNAERYDENAALDYIDAINSDAFQIGNKSFPAKSLRVMDITWDVQFAKSFRYFKVSMILKYRKRLWTEEIQQRGLYYYPSGVSSDKKRILVNKVEAVEPKLLKADGDVLAEGSPAVYKTVELLEEKAFSGLLTFCRGGMTNLDLISFFEPQDEDA
jgi:hypothetical protein